jgi:peptidoglycan/LPS O-acetylase OafA/YrhL
MAKSAQLPRLETKPYFPNLDASRFVAFLLVFIAHCFVTTNASLASSNWYIAITSYGKLGFLGLEYFFVLSSFLITYLIFHEKEHTGQFGVKNFLIRRSLRVWPLYFLIVLLGYGLTFWATHFAGIHMADLPPLPYFLFFWVNFYAAQHGTDFLFFLAFLWSISIEEQFYLCWAFLLRILHKNRFQLMCWTLILISLAFRFSYLNDSRNLYFHTVSTLGNFGIGALAAYAAYYNTKTMQLFRRVSSIGHLLFYLILICSILLYHALREFSFFVVIQRSYYALLFAWFIFDQALNERRLFNLGNLPYFNYLGKIAYGLYCFHGVVITLLIKLLENSSYEETPAAILGFFPFLIFACTVVVAAVSYRYIETPFLQMKKRFNFAPNS